MPWDLSFGKQDRQDPDRQDPDFSCGPAMRTSFLLISLVLFHQSIRELPSCHWLTRPPCCLPNSQSFRSWPHETLANSSTFHRAGSFILDWAKSPRLLQKPSCRWRKLQEVGFSEQPSVSSVLAQEGVGGSQQLLCPDFQAWGSDICKRRLGYLIIQ